jgi:hypothetical protein
MTTEPATESTAAAMIAELGRRAYRELETAAGEHGLLAALEIKEAFTATEKLVEVRVDKLRSHIKKGCHSDGLPAALTWRDHPCRHHQHPNLCSRNQHLNCLFHLC